MKRYIFILKDISTIEKVMYYIKNNISIHNNYIFDELKSDLNALLYKSAKNDYYMIELSNDSYIGKTYEDIYELILNAFKIFSIDYFEILGGD